MESNRRKGFDTYQSKITIYEDFLEDIANKLPWSYGVIVTDCTVEEYRELSWNERDEHVMKDEEGLPIHTQPYPDDTTDLYEQSKNERYKLAVEAYKEVRKALERWLDK